MATNTVTSGVDWGQAASIGKSLLVSPLFGFVLAGLFLLVSKVFIRDKRLYEAPKTNARPLSGSVHC